MKNMMWRQKGDSWLSEVRTTILGGGDREYERGTCQEVRG
jgi:hypothetical protein